MKTKSAKIHVTMTSQPQFTIHFEYLNVQLTWMYSYDGYIRPKYCKCCMQEKLTFRLPWQLIKSNSLD